jgi:hypothetical protein
MRILKIFLLLIFISSNSVTIATEYLSYNTVRVEKGDTLRTDLIASGRYIEIMGFVNGDMYAAGQQVTIAGEVYDNVTVAAQTVTLRGNIGGTVISTGQTVIIDGKIDSDVIVFSGDVRITENSSISGNLFVGTGYLRMEGGNIGGWIHGGAGEIYLNGKVKDSVIIGTDKASFGKNYSAKGTKLEVKDDFVLSEVVNPPEDLETVLVDEDNVFSTIFFFWSLISMFIVGLLIALFFKNSTKQIVAYANDNILKNLGIGFIALVVIPVLAAILLLLIITIPAALILTGLYLILLYTSTIYSGFFVGSLILGTSKKIQENKLILSLLVGLIIVFLLGEIPFIGWLFSLIFICFGMGSVLTYAMKTRKKAF